MANLQTILLAKSKQKIALHLLAPQKAHTTMSSTAQYAIMNFQEKQSQLTKLLTLVVLQLVLNKQPAQSVAKSTATLQTTHGMKALSQPPQPAPQKASRHSLVLLTVVVKHVQKQQKNPLTTLLTTSVKTAKQKCPTLTKLLFSQWVKMEAQNIKKRQVKKLPTRRK